MESKVKRTKTPAQALTQLMRLCARSEKSSGDALRLMRAWGVEETQREGVLNTLREQKFIDDERYAAAFVREKTNLSGWGTFKIRAALVRKGIAAPLVDAALAQMDASQQTKRLETLLAKKVQTIRYGSPYELKNKLLRYGLSLGYAYDTVSDTLAGLVKATDEWNEF